MLAGLPALGLALAACSACRELCTLLGTYTEMGFNGAAGTYCTRLLGSELDMVGLKPGLALSSGPGDARDIVQYFTQVVIEGTQGGREYGHH